MTNCYKQIQLTNDTVGAVEVNAFMPLGKITRRINAPYACCNTFSVSSSVADTLNINDYGFYKITYSLTGSAAETGEITLALVVDGVTLYEVSQYVGAADASINLTLPYTIRVNSAASTLPVTVQVQNLGLAVTEGSSNLIIEKI